MINLNCNFTSVFAKFNTVNEINELANAICQQVKTAHEARMKEITSASIELEATVEVGTANAPTQQETPAKKERKNKAASKMEKAKAMAEKFKEAEKKSEKPSEKPAAESPTKKERKTDKSEKTIVSKEEVAAMKACGLVFEKYNDRCWVLRGDTKPIKKMLKEEFKGVFNAFLTGGEGWVIRNDKVEECAKALGLKVKVA